jgi:hypothetical protein
MSTKVIITVGNVCGVENKTWQLAVAISVLGLKKKLKEKKASKHQTTEPMLLPIALDHSHFLQ